MSITTDVLPNHYFAHNTQVLTKTLWRIAHGEPELAQSAVAWVIRNRVAQQAHDLIVFGDAPLTPITQCAIDEVCEEVIAEAALVSDQAPDLSDGANGAEPDATSFLQLQEVAQRVWRGDFSDPTGGATRCCRHDHEPSWRRRLQPKALLGSFLFYR
jgi:spore germination cell wall hydrolase CwlJ-like protein